MPPSWIGSLKTEQWCWVDPLPIRREHLLSLKQRTSTKWLTCLRATRLWCMIFLSSAASNSGYFFWMHVARDEDHFKLPGTSLASPGRITYNMIKGQSASDKDLEKGPTR